MNNHGLTMEKKWQGHSGKVVAKKDRHYIIDCKVCLFKHVIPLPKEKELINFYGNNFYSNHKNYVKNHLREVEWHNLEFDEKYDLFDKYLPSSKHKTVLDIGSGPGLFLKRGVERGWQAVGVEPSRNAWKFSSSQLQLKVHNVFFNEKTYRQFGIFDVIHLNNVLEHLLNPRITLSLVHQILKPNGLLCITVPNDFNPLQKVVVDYYQKDMWWVCPAEHINYFDRYSLASLLRFVGIKPVYHMVSFPMEFFLLMGEDYIAKPPLGKKAHAKCKHFEMVLNKTGNNQLRKNIYSALSELGIGRKITIVGRK